MGWDQGVDALDGEIQELRAENERLRKVLKEIAEYYAGYPADSVIDEMREIAHEALRDNTKE